MNEIVTLQVSTISHIPRKVRPLLAQVFTSEPRHARLDGLLGYIRFSLLPKVILRSPLRGRRKKRYVVEALISKRLHRWQEGDLVFLWEEARSEAKCKLTNMDSFPISKVNAGRALRYAREGRYSDAMRALGVAGCASHDNTEALKNLVSRHPQHPLPVTPADYVQPSPLSVDSEAVLSALKSFPREPVQEAHSFVPSTFLMQLQDQQHLLL